MHLPQRRTFALKTFEGYFSDEVIVNELCRFRVKLAKKRNDALFLHRISSDAQRISDGHELQIFPPRRQWKRFRPARRGKQGSLKSNLTALRRAVAVLRLKKPKPKWARELERFVTAIRNRALAPTTSKFNPPRILPGEKDPAKHEYRPIAVFQLKDKVIESITARYLREIFDCALTDSCLAFRCGRNGMPPPQTHDAVQKILNVNRYHRRRGLFVAECDIKGFFDCVAHSVALSSLEGLERDAKRKMPRLSIDPRAKRIFIAYLNIYSFPRTIMIDAVAQLKRW